MTDLFPPFEPGDEPRRRRFKPVPLRVILPNLVTLLSLCAGLTAMRLAFEGGDDKLDKAVIAILIAAVLDGLDGRLARLLKGTSRFGAELDSLADFVSFGVAPAFILWAFSLSHLGSFGWICALLFAMACALRLARFNVSIDDPSRPDWQKNFFVGIPAPAGALTALLPVYLHLVGIDRPPALIVLEALYTLVIALMMVSRVPTYAGKTLGSRVPREWVVPLLLAFALSVALLVIHTFPVLLGITLVYLALIPWGISRYRRLELAHAATVPKSDPRPSEPAQPAAPLD
jgi:CDP-diacylglycerol--serine O-phosphatidyltransferase